MDIELIGAKVDPTAWQAYVEAMQSVLTEYMAETELPNQRCVARAMSGVNVLYRMGLRGMAGHGV